MCNKARSTKPLVTRQEYQIATPRRLYIYNDLIYCRSPQPEAAALGEQLDGLEEALRKNPRVTLLDIGEQIERLSRLPVRQPFEETLVVGEAGARTAGGIHARTGWFPKIRQISVTREEIAGGTYQITSTASQSLEAQLSRLAGGPLALVDDTIYSGLTLQAVLSRLPAASLTAAHIFCLQGIARAVAEIRGICPVSLGIELHGEPGSDVSIIKASHLFIKGAIRPAGHPELAFFEREPWMRAWFPSNADEILARCRSLALLASPLLSPSLISRANEGKSI